MEEALDPTTLTTSMETNTSHSKREIIDAFLRLKRAEEEICMLTVEMKHTINYYEHEVECVQKCIQDYSLQESDAFSRGAVTLLHGLLVKLQVHLHESLNLYSSIDKSTASTLSVPSYSDSDLEESPYSDNEASETFTSSLLSS